MRFDVRDRLRIGSSLPVLQLPKVEDVVRQNNLTVRDLPARSSSVLLVIGLSVFHLPADLIVWTALAYLLVELWGIFALRAVVREMTWLSYANLMFAAFIGSVIFLRIPYEMWQLDGLAPKLFAFCTLTTALIHCATVRGYHLPLAILTGLPVIVTICLTVVHTLLNKERLADTLMGLSIIGVMVSYITVMMIEGAKGRRALIRAREAADAANVAKGRFLASMTHEIRTPLNGILGVARLIYDASTTRDEKEQAEVLVSSAESLKILVDDALDHAKVEAGKLILKPVPADIKATVTSVVRLFEAVAEDKGIQLTLKFDNRLPALLTFDPVRLRQILSNLISNAIKFTDEGGVKVHVSAGEMDARCIPLTISVVDTGIGISAGNLEQLFEIYSQIDNKAERAATGTGLGLAISRSLAELMGGSIAVQSEEGEGSVFSLKFAPELAVERREHGKMLTPKNSSFAGLRVLVVDDSNSNRFVVRAFLKDSGAVVAEVDDGAKAVAYATDVAFDVILMDLHMPILGGMDAFRQIRDGKGKSASASIVALTGDGTDDDRDAVFEAGMDGFLAKPLSKDALLAELNRHVVTFGLAEGDGELFHMAPKKKGASPLRRDARF